MRICHVTEYCHASSYGGTERYILELCQGLSEHGVITSICWLSGKDSGPSFVVDGIEIIPIKAPVSRIEPPNANFETEVNHSLFSLFKPDILHFHTFGLAEAALAQTAVKFRIPYVFTYHSAAWTCRRDTLLLWGKKPCDGEVKTLRCSACKLQERIGGPPLTNFVLTFFFFLCGLLSSRLSKGSFRRRTSFVQDTKRFRKALQDFIKNCSLNVSCCEWGSPVLMANGAKPASLFHCPQGVSQKWVNLCHENHEIGSENRLKNFVVGYVGRTTPSKGIHILLEAFRRMDHPDMRLRILGWTSGRYNQEYANSIVKHSDEDNRIEILPEIPFDEALSHYQDLTILAIPSVGMETGPLVLFEALQLGVFVVGSSRVGQIDLLRKYGTIVEPNTPEAWQTSLENLYLIFKQKKMAKEEDKKKAKESIRSMEQVTAEMVARYASLIEK